MPTHERLSEDEFETLRQVAGTMTVSEIAEKFDRTRGLIIAAAFEAGVLLKRSLPILSVGDCEPHKNKSGGLLRKRRLNNRKQPGSKRSDTNRDRS